MVEAIVFPDEQHRSRRVVSRSNARTTGKYPSQKMKRMMHWESTNELNAFILLDIDPRVSAFGEQPCRITYKHDGIIHNHFPDILVHIDGRKEFQEVKTLQEALKPDTAIRTALLQDLSRWGYTYRIVLAEDLALQPRLSNARKLIQFGRRPVSIEDTEIVRLVLQREGRVLWSDVCSGRYGSNGQAALCRMVLMGKLRFDTCGLWSGDSLFLPSPVGA